MLDKTKLLGNIRKELPAGRGIITKYTHLFSTPPNIVTIMV